MVIKDFDEIYGIEIPDSWNVEKLEPKVGNVKSGKRLPKGFYVTDMHTNHPYIRVIDMREGYVDTSELKYVPDKAFSAIQNYRIYKDDIYISVAGTLGIVGQIPAHLDGANLTENANRVTNIKCNVKYLMYWLMSSTIQNIISQTQTLGAQPKLALTRIRNFPVILPSIQEQEKIVEVLSEVDTLIADLKKLIRKKKDIRQGTMQMLITGKRRLDGFDGEWVKINLSKNSKLKARIGWQGLTTGEYLDEGYSYLITGTDFKDGQIDWNGCHYVDYNRYEQDSNIQVSNGDLLLTKDGTIGKVAYVADLTRPATLNSGVFLVKPITDAYTAHFMFYVLESSVFKDFLQQLSAGSTINHLYQKDLVKFDLYVPPTKEEQEAIAGILFDMDSDIHRLEKKLSKYQKIKQGMMEELLTGKVRLM
nr:restriction endonuclease subunit S [uncultured Mogibacterium sp.]